MHYKLDGKTPIPCDLFEGASVSISDKIVERTYLKDLFISTAFSGIAHGSSEGRPVLFETMIFGTDSWADLFCRRYCTWEEALAGHNEVVAELQKGKSPSELDGLFDEED